MFDREEQNVKLLCKNDMVGKDIIIVAEDEEYFTVNLMVVFSK